MHLVLWFATGFLLASSVARLLRRPTGQPSGAQRQPTLLSLKGAILILLIFLAVLLAAGVDTATLPQWVLSWRSPFLGTRFQFLLWGAIFGALFQVFMDPISAGAKKIFDATIGNKKTTAWALQGTLAVLIVIAAVYLLKPDLLTSLRSVEYGGVKLTLAEQSTTARIASLNYKDFLWGFTLTQYEDLYKNYIREDSLRGKASRWVRDGVVDHNRNEITKALYPKYVAPVVDALICLEHNQAIDSAPHDPNLNAYAVRWQRFISYLRKGAPDLDENRTRAFLRDIAELSDGITGYVGGVVAACRPTMNDFELSPISDADEVEVVASKVTKLYNESKRLIWKSGDPSDFQVLLILEPYLVGALSDLIAILKDQERKAEFLVRTLEGFHRSDDMLTPGIINLFYQAADAQLKSSENWPFDEILIEIDYAIRGVSLMIARSSKMMEDHRRSGLSTRRKDNNGVVKPSLEQEVLETFERNLFILLSEKLALFNQRALGSERLNDAERQDWLHTYSRMIEILRARNSAPISVIESLPAAPLDEQSRQSWDQAHIGPEFLLDGSISMAMSSMLIEEGGGKISALGCNTALYFERNAHARADDLMQSSEAFVRKNHDVLVTNLKVSRILSIISNRIANSCDWRPDELRLDQPEQSSSTTTK
jgi:hypothetical protein